LPSHSRSPSSTPHQRPLVLGPADPARFNTTVPAPPSAPTATESSNGATSAATSEGGRPCAGHLVRRIRRYATGSLTTRAFQSRRPATRFAGGIEQKRGVLDSVAITANGRRSDPPSSSSLSSLPCAQRNSIATFFPARHRRLLRPCNERNATAPQTALSRPARGLQCTCRGSRGLLCGRLSAQTFRGDVEQRNDEDAEYRGGDHAAEHRCADRMARQRPSTTCKDQG
jgi:hypothetical protein